MDIKYRIMLRDKNGNYVSEIREFISLQITDTANSVGEWRIISKTKDDIEFEAGYGVVIFRNDVYILSGFMTEVESTATEDGTWSWSIRGKTDFDCLYWRVVHPDPSSSNPIGLQYATYDHTSNTFADIIVNLVKNNLSYQAPSARGGAMSMVGVPETKYPITLSYPAEDKKYRFESLGETVVNLANEGDIFIQTTWDETYQRIIYKLTDGFDLSNTVVFSDKNNNVRTVKYIMREPDYSVLVCQYNSDYTPGDSTHVLWRYVYKGDVTDYIHSDSMADEWLIREMVISPNQNDVQGGYFGSGIYTYLQEQLALTKIYTEGNEIELESTPTAPVYQQDYKLGDKISVEINGRRIIGTVMKIELNYSYGSESIKPTLDIIDNSLFRRMKEDIRNIKKQSNQMYLREV